MFLLSVVVEKVLQFNLRTNMWQALISPVANLVGGYLKNKHQEKQAVHASKMRRIEADADWEAIQADASTNSWKDEWFAVILSLPLIGAFIPDIVPYVERGFAVLETMPDYYKAFLGGAIAASFGLKSLSNWGKK